MLQHFGVTPYLVFDGDKLPAKRCTEDDRETRRAENLAKAQALEAEGKMREAREVYGKCVDITPEMAFQLIKVLKEEGIPYVVAPYEADAQLAYLEREGLIDGVVTEDSDLLVFGCRTVLFKLDQAGNCVEMKQERFWTNKSLALSGWSTVEFRQMAILSGCDYLPSIVGMGLKNAHRLLRRYKTVDKVLQAVRLEGKMRVPEGYGREFRKAELTFVHQRVFDPRSQKLVTLTPLPDGTKDEMLPFIGAGMGEEEARGVAEGVIDPITRMRVVDRVPKPLAVRSSSSDNVVGRSKGSMMRSTTEPKGMGSSFYRSGVAGPSKKVVSKEAGLQSLKNFFGGATTTKQKKTEETRTPLAPRDTNRPSPPRPKQVEEKGTQSKFFSSRTVPKSPALSQQNDHAYLHLGGQLTPKKPKTDPNDSGYWDDNCHDLGDFAKSSSPPAPIVQQTQGVVVESQELWQDDLPPPATTQVVLSTASSSSAVVVPQTPSKRKRMHSATGELLSSPEGSGFISSPASSSSVCREQDTVPSSPLLPIRLPEEDEVEAVEPVTPAPRGMGERGAKKPTLVTSASLSKLEAFRCPGSVTPQLKRRATEVTTTTPTANGLKLLENASMVTPSIIRPAKVMKRSPTLLLGEGGEEEDGEVGGKTRGLFERFRFTEQAAPNAVGSRQLPF